MVVVIALFGCVDYVVDMADKCDAAAANEWQVAPNGPTNAIWLAACTSRWRVVKGLSGSSRVRSGGKIG